MFNRLARRVRGIDERRRRSNRGARTGSNASVQVREDPSRGSTQGDSTGGGHATKNFPRPACWFAAVPRNSSPGSNGPTREGTPSSRGSRSSRRSFGNRTGVELATPRRNQRESHKPLFNRPAATQRENRHSSEPPQNGARTAANSRRLPPRAAGLPAPRLATGVSPPPRFPRRLGFPAVSSVDGISRRSLGPRPLRSHRPAASETAGLARSREPTPRTGSPPPPPRERLPAPPAGHSA